MPKKRQYVIQLYEEDNDFKQIAQLTDISLRDIITTVKQLTEKIERENGQLEESNDDYDIKSTPKTTQTFKMFSEGKSSTGAVIELDLPAEEVTISTLLIPFLKFDDVCHPY